MHKKNCGQNCDNITVYLSIFILSCAQNKIYNNENIKSKN